MRQSLFSAVLAACLLTGSAATAMIQQDHSQHAAPSPTLKAAIAGATRTPANTARDRYRNPGPTLAFFGVEPDDTVVEIWPGGGWYTEILAPYLATGTLYAAGFESQIGGVRKKAEAEPALYGKVKYAGFPVFEASEAKVPDGSADIVLTFRNVHNWKMGYQRNQQDYSVEAFKQIYAMLKPGGVLGIVDHRLPESASAERERTSGYVKTSTVRQLAEQAGFRFAGASEVNANPKDTTDYPKGVWTLPPRYAEGATDREKYAAIGESDRMTLKFVKPE